MSPRIGHRVPHFCGKVTRRGARPHVNEAQQPIVNAWVGRVEPMHSGCAQRPQRKGVPNPCAQGVRGNVYPGPHLKSPVVRCVSNCHRGCARGHDRGDCTSGVCIVNIAVCNSGAIARPSRKAHVKDAVGKGGAGQEHPRYLSRCGQSKRLRA